MKKKIIVIVMAVAMLMSGCGKEGLHLKKSDEWKVKWTTQLEREVVNIVPYQNGFYYCGVPDCLSYYDIDSGESVVLCNKNGCNHDTEKCFAYVDTLNEMPEIHDDKLYFVSWEGDVSVANADNTEKKKAFTLLKELKEKEAFVFVEQFLMTEEYLFFEATVTEYTEEGEKSERRIYAMDMDSKKETLIASADVEKQHFMLESAYRDILYYTCQDIPEALLLATDLSPDVLKEAEKSSHTELYRMSMKETEPEKIIEVDNGYVAAVTDDYGVYYTEYSGVGSGGCSKMFRIKRGEEKAELVFSTEDPKGFSFAIKNSEYFMLSVEEENRLYSAETMKQVQAEWEYPRQPAFAFPVPGGFAVPKKEPRNGEERNYCGEEWKYFRLQSGIYQ